LIETLKKLLGTILLNNDNLVHSHESQTSERRIIGRIYTGYQPPFDVSCARVFARNVINL